MLVRVELVFRALTVVFVAVVIEGEGAIFIYRILLGVLVGSNVDIGEIPPTVGCGPANLRIGEVGVAINIERRFRHTEHRLTGVIGIGVADASCVETEHVVVFPCGRRCAVYVDALYVGQVNKRS